MPATLRGNVTVSPGGLYGRTYISGSTSTSIDWPLSILPPIYTLFHIAKYNNGVKGRIFTGSGTDLALLNWLSGFCRGYAGVAYHNGWLTPTVDCCGYNWVLSTDQNGLYRCCGDRCCRC